ncbi:MAG: protein kinase [Candidatus Nitrosocosmicus sp.]|nr:protein kinase [Candidatus Nitrosocosmicus sp.]MDN5868042.1 protein kinase [Candidatus Nitrosocosmicus sp.]
MSCDDLKIGQSFKLHNIEFTVEKKLPSGSFGDPYIIKRDGFRCVLKSNIFEGDEYFMNGSNYKALLNESKIGMNLGLHPNVVTFLTFERKKSNCIYTAMEYVKGGELVDLFREDGIPDFRLLIDLSIDIASGLNHLHTHGVTHRDLNPTNILLESPFDDQKDKVHVARVTDYSISYYDNKLKNDPDKCHEEKEFNEIDHYYVGNESYVSPEQLDKCSSGKEKDADVFAFGMLLLHMVTGEISIDQKSLHQTFDLEASKKDIGERIYPSLLTNRKNLDSRIIELIKDLIIKCLHYYPNLRWKIEKENSPFEYFETIRKELLNIRHLAYKGEQIIESEFPNIPYLYQLRGSGFAHLECYDNATYTLLKSLELTPNNVSIQYQRMVEHGTQWHVDS